MTFQRKPHQATTQKGKKAREHSGESRIKEGVMYLGKVTQQ